MSKIRMDYARSDLSDRSFVCLDFSFFTDEAKKEEKKRTPVQAVADGTNQVAVDYTKLSKAMMQKTQELIESNPRKYDNRKKEKVTEDAFGFVDDSESEESGKKEEKRQDEFDGPDSDGSEYRDEIE